MLVPSGAGGAAISFDDSVAGLSAGALSGIVLVDSLTYQDSVALSKLNFKNGSLVVNNNATLGGFESAAGTTLTVGGTLDVNVASGSKTMAGLFNGAGSLSKTGAGTLVMTGGSAYTGSTTISAGTLQVGDATTTGNLGSGNIVNNATLVFKRSNAMGIANVISGTGEVKQEGAGALTLSATNTYTGATYVNAGTLAISTDDNLGAAPTSTQAAQLVVNNATLYFYPVFTTATQAKRGLTLIGSTTLNTAEGSSVTWAGPVTGTGLTKAGAGTLILTGANSYAATTVSAGTLQVGNGGSTGTLGTGAATVTGTLAFNHSAATTVGNAISGAGSLNKLGSNTLTLTGAQTYTGATDVAGGLVFQNDVAPTTIGFTGAGAVTIEPSSASFTAASFTPSYTFANSLSGLTLGKPDSSTNITIGSNLTLSGPVKIYGGTIDISANINTTAGGNAGDVLLKASGNIVLGSSKSITTTGGDVVLWANSDSVGAGNISLGSGASIQTSGGNLVLAGGADDGANGSTANDGTPDGYARGVGTAGISTTGSFTLNSGAGALVLRGSSDLKVGVLLSATTTGSLTTTSGRMDVVGVVDAAATPSDTQMGVLTTGGGTLNITSATGLINLSGEATRYGIAFGVNSTSPYATDGVTQTVIQSGNTTSNAISIVGTGTSGGSHGLSLRGASTKVYATAALGGITLSGVSNNWSSAIYSPVDVLAVSGPIRWLNSDATSGIYAATTNITFGSKSGVAGLDTSSSDVTVYLKLLTGTPTIAIGTTGAVKVQGVDGTASFGQTFNSSKFAFNANGQTMGSLVFGSPLNTQALTIDQTLTANGPITVYGGALAINAPLTATNSTVKLTGTTITDGASGYITADKLALLSGAVTLDHTSNNVGTLAASGVSSLTYVNSGALTIGTVNPTGITATGDVRIETLSGDLTVAADVVTTSTTANAVLLNAGKNTAAGTSTGGNILVSGTPTLTAGTNGVIRLMGGSVTGSTGLTDLVGSGSGHFRYNSDEAATRYSVALSPNVINAIYREQPTATTNIDSFTVTYGYDHTTTLNNFKPDGTTALSTVRTAVNGDDAVAGLGVIIEGATYSTGNKLVYRATPYTLTDGFTKLGYATSQTGGSLLTVAKKDLSFSGLVISSKTYDGNANANLSISSTTLPDKITGDDVSVSSVTGAFDTRHVGTAKTVTITAATIAGTDVGNYTVNLNGQGGTANINQLASATYVGASGGDWSNAANWAVTGTTTPTGVLPDGSNVALAIIPTGLTVVAKPPLSPELGYTGKTQIAGTLQVAADSYLGAAPVSATPDLITLNGGTLQATDSFTLHTNRGITLDASGGTFSVDASKSVAYAGVMAGTGGLTKSGSGTLTLTGGNTNYSGVTTVSVGNLIVGGAGNALGTGSVSVASRLSFDTAAAASFANGISITGTGVVENTGSHAVTLTGVVNTNLTATTVVDGGTAGIIISGSATPTGSGAGYNIKGNLTFQGHSLNSLVIRSLGDSKVTFAASGGVSNFTLWWLGGETSSTALSVEVGAGLTVSEGASQGAGNLYYKNLSGAGTLNLGGTTSTGFVLGDADIATLIASGSKKISIGELGSVAGRLLSGNVQANSGLLLDSTTDYTFAGVQSAGTLTKQRANTVKLTGANTSTGAITVSAGILQVGDAGTTGAITGNAAVTSGASLVFSRSNAASYVGNISGAGTVTKLGPNVLTLTGTQTYTGATATGDVGGGLVFTNNTLPVTPGAFTGNGFVTIQPVLAGSFGGTLSTSAYSFGSSLTGLTLGRDGNTSTITVNSLLSIAGPISIYGGTINLSADITSTVANAAMLFKSTGDINQAANVDVLTTGGSTVYWANSDGGNRTGMVLLETGATITTQGGHVWMGGSAAANGQSTWHGLTVGDGYAASGTSVAFAGGSNWLSGIVLKRSQISSGGGDVSLYGYGATSGSGFVNFDNTTINSGTGQILINAKSSGIYAFLPGLHPGVTPGAAFELRSANTGVDAIRVVVDGVASSTPGAVIEGNFRMLATNGGGVTLSGRAAAGTAGLQVGSSWGSGVMDVLSTTGNITLDAGTNSISFQNASSAIYLGSKSGSAVQSATGNISMTADSLSLASALTYANTTGTLTIAPTSASFSSAVNSTGWVLGTGLSALTVGSLTNTANITWASSNTVNGPIKIYGGNITLNSAIGTTNVLTGDVLLRGADVNSAYNISLADGRTLTVDNTGTNSIVSGIISGTGANLVKQGTGALYLRGVDTYSGNTTVDAGYLELSTTGSLVTDVLNNAGLGFNQTANYTFAKTISGTGYVVKYGSNTLTLTAANTYTGVTNLQGGTLSVSSLANGGVASNIGQSTNAAANLVINNATLKYTGAATSTDRLFTLGDSGATVDASGTGALVFTNTGALVYSGTAGRLLTLTGTNTADNTMTPVLANNVGISSFTKAGTGKWVMKGVNTYSGLTTVSGGTLNVGDGTDALASLGTNTVSLAAGTTLNFNHNNVVSVGNAISGSGQLNKLGGNTLSLTGVNSYTGATGVGSAGGVVFTNNTAPTTVGFTGSGTVTIEPSTTFASAGISNYTFANTISGFTWGKSSNVADLTIASPISIAGPISLYGGNINLNANVSSSLANAALLFKASGDITQASNVAVGSNGGDITLWANSDGDTTNYGGILLNSGSSINSSNGNITLGGGTSLATGYATHKSTSVGNTGSSAADYSGGVALFNASISAGTGAVTVRGESVGSVDDYAMGILLRGDAGTSSITGGAVSLVGISNNASNASGVSMVNSTVTAATNLTVSGTTTQATSSALMMDATSTLTAGGTTNISGNAKVVLGNVDSTGALSISTTSGSVSQVAGTTVLADSTTSVTVQNADVTLNNTGNDMGGLISVSNAANLTLRSTLLKLGSIATSGVQTYNSPVQLMSNPTFDGHTITFASTVNGDQSFTVIDSGHTLLAGAVGASAAPTRIDMTAIDGIEITGGKVRSSGPQWFKSPVLVSNAGNTIFDSTAVASAGANITFEQTLNAAGVQTESVGIDAGTGGIVRWKGVVGGDKALNTLTLSNAASFTFEAGLNAKTLVTEAMPYSVSILERSTLTDLVEFKNTQALKLINTSTTDDFVVAGGMKATAPSELALSGKFKSTNQAMVLGRYDSANPLLGNVTLLDDTTLDTGSTVSTAVLIKIGGKLDGGFDFVANSAGVTQFERPVGSLQPLHSLQTDALGYTDVSGSSITAKAVGGTVSIKDPLTLSAASIRISAGAKIEFADTVANASGQTAALILKTASDGTILASKDMGSDTARLGSLSILDTGSATFIGSVYVDTLSTEALAYNLSFKGDKTYVTHFTEFKNSGTVQLGALSGTSALHFESGLEAVLPSTLEMAGTVKSLGHNMVLGTPSTHFNLLNDLTLDAGNADIDLRSKVSGDVYALNLITTGTGKAKFSGGEISTSGNLTLRGEVVFANETKLTASQVTLGGATTVNGKFTIDGAAILAGGAVDTTGFDQVYKGAVTLSTQEATLTGSNVTFESTVDGAQRLVVHALGDVTFGGDVGKSLTIAAPLHIETQATTTRIKGEFIRTSGQSSILFNNDVVLTSALTEFDTTAYVNGSGNGANITFNGLLNGVDGTQSVTFKAGTLGVVTAEKAIADVATLTLSSSNGANFNDAVSAGSIVIAHTKLGQTVSFLGDVTASTFTTLFADGYNLVFKGASNKFTHAVDFLNTGGLQLGDANRALSATPTDVNFEFVNGVKATSPNSVMLAGRFKSSHADMAFGSSTADITLGNAVAIDSGSGDVIFNGALDSEANQHYSLNVVNGGYLTFQKAVGQADPLSTLTISGGGNVYINGGEISTTGAQSYGNAVVLGDTTTLNALGVNFDRTISAAAQSLGLTVNNPGTTTFNGDVDIGWLETDGGGTSDNKVEIQTASIKTTGTQHYGERVSLTSAVPVTLTGAGVTFADTLDGPQALTIEDSGVTTFTKEVGHGTALASLTIKDNRGTYGTVHINGGEVTTTGAQDYQNAVEVWKPTTTLNALDVTFAKSVNGKDATAVNLTVNASVGNTSANLGHATFDDTVGSSAKRIGTLIVNSMGTTTFKGDVDVGSLETDGGGTTDNKVEIQTASIKTSGTQHYGERVSLTSAVPVTLTGAGVTFADTLDGPQALTIEDSGVTTFTKEVGQGTALASLTIKDNRGTYGTVHIDGGEVTTTGAQDYQNAVEVWKPTTTLNALDVTFAKSVNGKDATAVNLTVSASVGNTSANLGHATFDDTVGSSAKRIGTLIVNSMGTTTFKGDVDVGSLETDGGGTTDNKVEIQTASIKTTGTQHYGERVSLTSAVPVTLTGAGVTFADPLDGPQALTIEDSGVTTFTKEVGHGTALASLTIKDNGGTYGTVHINGGEVTTTGAQDYQNAVEVWKPTTTLNALDVTFAKSVNGKDATAVNLTVNASVGNTSANFGHATFDDTVSSSAKRIGTLIVNSMGTTTFKGDVDVGSLETDGGGTSANQVNINTANIKTTGTQHYGERVSLTSAAPVTLTGAGVTFAGTLDGPQALTIEDSGVTTFTKEVGQGTALASLTIKDNGGTYGTVHINGGEVTTTGAQSYGNAVVLGNTTTLNALGVNFDRTISAAAQSLGLTVNNLGTTTFNGDVDIGWLETDGGGTSDNKVEIQTASIKTTGTQHYGERVSLTSAVPVTLTGAGVTFADTLDGPQALTIEDSGVTTFTKEVGQGTALASLTIKDNGGVHGTVHIDGGEVTTTGAQSYGNAVVLGDTTTLNALGVNFDRTITAAAQSLGLTVNNLGTTTFKGDVDIGWLETDGGGTSDNKVEIQTASIKTTGTQHYGERVSLTSPVVTLSATSVTFDRPVDGQSLIVDAIAKINGGGVTTTGSQTYSDQMILGDDTTLTSTTDTLIFRSITDGASTSTSTQIPVFNLNLKSAMALTLGDVNIGGQLALTTKTGGVSQRANTSLNIGGAATLTADAGTHQVAALTSANNTFTGRLTFNQVNSGSWADVSVTTDAPLTLGPLQSGGSVNLQTQGALTSSTISTSGSLTLNSHGGAVSVGASTVSGSMSVQTGGGAMAQTGQFVVTGNTSITAGTGTITLLNALNNFGGALALQGASTSVATSGNLQLANVTNTGPMTLLAPQGSIDLGTAFITGGDLTLQSRDNMNLGGANITGSLNMSSTTGTVSFGQATVMGNLTAATQGQQVDLGSASVGGNLSVQTNGGNILQSTTPNAALHVTGISTLNAGTGNVTLPNMPNQFGGAVSLQANNVQLVGSDGLILGNSTVTGNLSVTAATGNVTQNAPLTVTGTSTFNAIQGDVVLAQANTFVQPMAVNAVNVTVHAISALTLGASTVTGDLMATVDQGDLTQTAPLTVGGKTDLITATGNVALTNAANSFADLVSVDTAGTLKLTSGGPLTLGQVKTVGDTDLKSNGKLDLGISVFGAKVNANSGGFDIVQTGPIKVGGNSNFEAGNAKIDLFNPKNAWSGSILYKGGIVMINHPQLMNAVNAGTLVVRAETSAAQTAKVSAPASTGTAAANGASSGTANGDSAVSVAVTRPASSNQTGLITVAVSSEAAAPGRSFSFSIESQVPAATATNTEVRVTQADGKPLPEWLRYEATTKTFVATTVPPGAFPLQLKVGIGGVETLMVISEKPPGQ
ncbi:hypothetical protein LINBF2_12970 [Limnohabitans sp. INBF002]|nr:hypothetical protein LINBF2_12970 [Limnohabitans sp. INBF002]